MHLFSAKLAYLCLHIMYLPFWSNFHRIYHHSFNLVFSFSGVFNGRIFIANTLLLKIIFVFMLPCLCVCVCYTCVIEQSMCKVERQCQVLVLTLVSVRLCLVDCCVFQVTLARIVVLSQLCVSVSGFLWVLNSEFRTPAIQHAQQTRCPSLSQCCSPNRKFCNISSLLLYASFFSTQTLMGKK